MVEGRTFRTVHRGAASSPSLAYTELSTALLLYILGACDDATDKAEALASVLFMGKSIRAASREYGVHRDWLSRASRRTREAMARHLRSGRLRRSDLVSPTAASGHRPPVGPGGGA